MSEIEARQHVENGAEVPAYIVEGLLAEYAAVVAERDALREALAGMVSDFDGCYAEAEPAMIKARAALAQGEVGNG
jgi:hypothetical protein